MSICEEDNLTLSIAFLLSFLDYDFLIIDRLFLPARPGRIAFPFSPTAKAFSQTEVSGFLGGTRVLKTLINIAETSH
jgi:hypothetical protein